MSILIISPDKGSSHNAFYNALTNNSDSLALSQLWLCGFERTQLNRVGESVITWLKYYEDDTWEGSGTTLSTVIERLFNDKNFYVSTEKSTSYILTQGISFIPDGMNASRVGSQQTGALKGFVSDGRLDLNATNITFLETNISFVDGLLRPWSVLASHRSAKDTDLRVDIELICLEKWELNSPLKVRKSMVLKNALPINIDQEEYNYTGDKLIQRQVQFAFDHYELRVNPLFTNKALTRADVISVSKDTVVPDIGESGADEVATNAVKLSNILPPNPPQEVMFAQEGGGILDTINGILGNATGMLSRANGVVSDVTSNIAQGLNAFGMEGAADSVSDLNTSWQESVGTPAADILGTGQSFVGGAEHMVQAANIITGNSGPSKGPEIMMMEDADIEPAAILTEDAVSVTGANTAPEGVTYRADSAAQDAIDMAKPQ